MDSQPESGHRGFLVRRQKCAINASFARLKDDILRNIRSYYIFYVPDEGEEDTLKYENAKKDLTPGGRVEVSPCMTW